MAKGRYQVSLLIPQSAHDTIHRFCALRRRYSPVERISLLGQVGLAPRLLYMKFHLAELPQQLDQLDRKHCYTADKSQSGPLSIHSRLCNQFVKEELVKYVNFVVLSPQAESCVSSNVDVAFPIDEPPVKRPRQARSAAPRERAPDASQASSSSWGSGRWREKSKSTSRLTS